MNVLKKILAFVLAFVIVFQSSVDVFAGKKKSGKRASSMSKKSKSGKRASSMKKSSKSGKRAAATSKSGKRAAATRKSGRRASARSVRRAGGTVSTGSVAAVSTDGAIAPISCLSAYTECMDVQIPGFLSKFSYLTNDPAVEAVNETGEPLRCMYYYDYKNEKDDGNEKTTASSTFRDINYLYYAYDYYCTPSTAVINGALKNTCDNAKANVASGPVNKKTVPVLDSNGNQMKDKDGKPLTKEVEYTAGGAARLNTSDVFATQNSYAFYKEAFDQMENDELNIINFQETKYYKDNIAGLNLTNFNKNLLKTDDVSDILGALGISTKSTDQNGKETVKLFSLSVTPPIGAGSLVPQEVYRKAHNICMGISALPTPKASGLTQKVINEELRPQVLRLSNSNCKGLESTYKNYYLNGKLSSCPSGSSYDNISEVCKNSSGEEVIVEAKEVDFLSAKNSCTVFEQNLMSSRDKMYAKFESNMTNYLNKHLADLLKKQAKNAQTVAQAVSNLEAVDSEIGTDKIKRKAERTRAEAEAEIAVAEAEAQKAEAIAKKNAAELAKELAISKADAEKMKARAEKAQVIAEAKTSLVQTHSQKIKTACDNLAKGIVYENDGQVEDLFNYLSVCVNNKNQITPLGLDEGGTGMSVRSCADENDIQVECKADLAGMDASWNDIYSKLSVEQQQKRIHMKVEQEANRIAENRRRCAESKIKVSYGTAGGNGYVIELGQGSTKSCKNSMWGGDPFWGTGKACFCDIQGEGWKKAIDERDAWWNQAHFRVYCDENTGKLRCDGWVDSGYWDH